MYWVYPPPYYYPYAPYHFIMHPADQGNRLQLEPFQQNENNDAYRISDYGPQPFVLNIHEAAKINTTYRTAIWTGKYLQVTLMCINIGDDIGIEIHPDTDQFLRIEQGQGIVRMGESKDNLNFERNVSDDSAIMVPAGTWHNVINTGNTPLKLYSIYAPPHHPHGTAEATKADAMKEE
ncbi:cupin domain-containing protein [Virgibacillus sp. NKC19-3]|uniref:cupin domain-containing protein n=1 Tax=Virgibacillus saliphilus TaxID=2831674 RepID=UPI001C9A8A93|nr:cupin domain-containing protein [Virgibacillus sp. NKC19-3]MBY7142578.1 cupin domain-containing protein [Virgibacillus sp. NKC19-3]